MPLTGTESILAASMFSMVSAQLGPSPNPEAAAQLQKLCTGLANAIVPHIITMAQVAPGQVTVGSPASQLTTTPGVII
jgi:hypothetical protein